MSGIIIEGSECTVGKLGGTKSLCEPLSTLVVEKTEHQCLRGNARCWGNSPPASFPKDIHIASIRRTLLFLTSFTQLSAWTVRNAFVKSSFFDKSVNPRAINSHVLELLVLQTCGIKAVVTENPWMISVVDASRGLENDENSFEDMFLDRGQLCFWASIESIIQANSAFPAKICGRKSWNGPLWPIFLSVTALTIEMFSQQ